MLFKHFGGIQINPLTTNSEIFAPGGLIIVNQWFAVAYLRFCFSVVTSMKWFLLVCMGMWFEIEYAVKTRILKIYIDKSYDYSVFYLKTLQMQRLS